MRQLLQKRDAALLCVCYLAQLLIGTSQPFGLPAGLLVPVLAVGTLLQLAVYRLLRRRQFPASRAFGWLLAVCLGFAAGYDFVKADHFYRAVTSQNFSFWWLTACMLLIGWYAARCGRATVQRIAGPVLVLTLVSLVFLCAAGSGRLENLQPLSARRPDWQRALVVLLEYTFTAEPLLWFTWRTHPLPGEQAVLPGESTTPAGSTAKDRRRAEDAPWQAAVWLRFGVMALFSVLAELTLGRRFAGTPQVFGTLSLVSTGANAGHAGVLYHCVWLMALAVRVCALCCTLRGLCATLLPKMPARRRVAAEGAALIFSALLWAALWQRDCLVALSAAALALLGAALLWKGKREDNAASATEQKTE